MIETINARAIRARPALRRAALAVCGAIFLGLAVSYVITIASFGPRHTDFITYYSAGGMVLHGHGASIYDFRALASVERAVVHPDVLRYGVLPYVYPPYFGVAMAPLAALPFLAAYSLWLCFNLAVLARVLLALARYVELPRAESVMFGLGALTFLPAFVAMLQGQTSVVLLGLLAAAFLCARSGRDALAGVALALALIKAPYVVPILVVFLVQRRWTILAAFAGTAGFLATLPTLALGYTANTGYVHVLRLATAWHAQFGYSPHLSNDLAAAIQMTVGGPLQPALTVTLDLAVLAAVAWTASRNRSFDAVFGTAVAAGLLISPHVLAHDLTLLLLPVAIAVRHAANSRVPVLPAIGVGYAIMLAGFAAGVPLSTVPMIALAAWLSLGARRSERAITQPNWRLSHAG